MVAKPPTQATDIGLTRVSIVDRLTQLLRQRILRGEWHEGEQLRQETIAEEYQISRMPVREALRQLEMQGLIVFKNNKGAEVTKLSTTDIAELFDLRADLECTIFSAAIPKATHADYEAAEAAFEKLNGIYRSDDLSLCGELNWAFHKTLYEPADRPHTLSIINTINYHTDRYIRLHLMLKTNAVRDAIHDHTEILNAFKSKDVNAARDALKKHILNSKRELIASLTEFRNADK